jgi:hypothetical protein
MLSLLLNASRIEAWSQAFDHTFTLTVTSLLIPPI